MLQKWLSVGSKKEMRCDLFMKSKVAYWVKNVCPKKGCKRDNV
jgi:hypothetical protein